MTVTRTLKEIGTFPVVGDAIEVRDRWAPYPLMAVATITGTDATHVEVSSQLVIQGEPPVRYRIPRFAWAEKCAAPNRVVGGEQE